MEVLAGPGAGQDGGLRAPRTPPFRTVHWIVNSSNREIQEGIDK